MRSDTIGSPPDIPADPDASQRIPASRELDRITDRHVRRAAQAVLERYLGDKARVAGIAELLVLIGSTVTRRSEGLPAAVDSRLDSPLGRRLLVELRIAFARGFDEASPPSAMVTALKTWWAFEEILGQIGHGEQYAPGLDWDRDFANQLSGPRGLELVVEVAHDLRSPLTSILFLAETLQRGQSGSVNDIQRRQLGLIYSAALGLSTLASNVMELARGGSRLANDRPGPFSVRDVMESVTDIVRPMAEEKGLTVRLRPPNADYRLGPAQAISRVLLNLTTNAIKFTEEGFVEIAARESEHNRVEFSVRDTGPGVNPTAIETLFLPFRRGADDHQVRFSGTGLGLALCRKLVEAMGSELRYESGAEWGTRFYFEVTLPQASA